jgi:Icc-related predicted phosphoesterase
MIKLIHLSDTHLRHFNPEVGDILVHSGDALNYGTFEELVEFRDQLAPAAFAYKHVILIPGNHDRIFEESPELAESFLKETIPNLHVLNNKSIELLGLKFYGNSDTPAFCNWAFNKYPEELMQSYSNIPDDVDVLITHGPPKGILDKLRTKELGSSELRFHIQRLTKLKAHLFGHIHYSHGIKQINGVWYSNGAICDESYSAANSPNIIEL